MTHFEVNKLRKEKLISMVTMMIGIVMISIGMVIQNGSSFDNLSDPTIEEFDIKNMATSAKMAVKDDTVKNINTDSLLFKEVVMETAPASVSIVYKPYDEMTVEEIQMALNEGRLTMKYSESYTYSSSRLTKSRGALYFNGHKETYYSQNVLPGTSLRIPGRHIADDGTVRDGDGFICVAADPGYLAKGSVVITSLGPAKVYDTGCAYGTIDIYVNW